MAGLRAVGGGRWYVGAVACALVVLFALTTTGIAHAAGDSTARLRLDRSEGPPGTVVFASIQGYVDCGAVEIFWEGVEAAVGSAVVPASGAVDVLFSVPAEATAQKYSITSVCKTNPELTDDDLFVVTAGTVTPGTVKPETVAPQLVRVPRVVGLKITDAEAKVSAVGLVLRVPVDVGDVVDGQSPKAGSMVGVGHVVRVTTEQAAVAPQPTPSPTDEQPVGTASSAESFPWSAVLVVLGVLMAGTITYRVVRWRLDKRWVRNNLRVVVPPAPALDPQLTESDAAPPMLVVRIQPHKDAGIHILQGG
ncbi:PASTA domain-containing protein [Kribbella sp. NPDC051952]|uniref:PASTA domain-containing protein n=1 Tax=Kribbella sp. NPDC051952 TaxID=3154851 RepID=UPI00342A0454